MQGLWKGFGFMVVRALCRREFEGGVLVRVVLSLENFILGTLFKFLFSVVFWQKYILC